MHWDVTIKGAICVQADNINASQQQFVATAANHKIEMHEFLSPGRLLAHLCSVIEGRVGIERCFVRFGTVLSLNLQLITCFKE